MELLTQEEMNDEVNLNQDGTRVEAETELENPFVFTANDCHENDKKVDVRFRF
jgi:hypothetical protein